MIRIISILCIVVTALLVVNFGDDLFSSDDAKDAPSRPAIKVLFIGNSYTYYNDMPQLLESIAQSQQSSAYIIHTEHITKNGATLKQHWEEKNAVAKITSGSWHYVVLQEQSTAMLYDEHAKEAYVHMHKFNEIIKKAGARSILYVTWPRKPGHTLYEKHSLDFNGMEYQINNRSHQMAKQLGMGLIYTSSIWKEALRQNIPIYTEDGSHPSAYGSYLVALKLYKYMLPDTILDAKTLFIPKDVNKREMHRVLRRFGLI